MPANGVDDVVINELPPGPDHVAELACIERVGLLLGNDVADLTGAFAR